MGIMIEEQVRNIKEQLADVSAKYRMMQADYENRLKADMLAMLTDIQLEIEDFITDNHSSSDLRRNEAIICCTQVIQQKIDALKMN